MTATLVVPAPVGTSVAENQRDRFYRLLPELLAEEQRAVAVFADVGYGYLDPDAVAPVRDRVVNVGIREQLLIGAAGGLALAGLRPIVHTFAPFLVERPFEQVKLDIGHQGSGAVLVSAGGSHDWPAGGETHMGRRDVALLDTLDGWTVHVPGHPDEVEVLLRAAIPGDGRVYLRLGGTSNAVARPVADGRMQVLRRGFGPTVIAVGPLADRVLEATADLDVTVLYAATVRPFDASDVARDPRRARRRARRAVPARHVHRGGGARAARHPAPGAGARAGSAGAAPLRHRRRPRRRARPRCGRSAARDHDFRRIGVAERCHQPHP